MSDADERRTGPDNPGRPSARPSPPFSATWHLLLDSAGAPGWRNMSLDQAMLDLAEHDGHGYFRLYRWQPHGLSFGRNEPALRRYDRSSIETLGIEVVRRPTGGRAVWHGEELTYAIAAPSLWFGTLAEAYRTIHEMLAEALGRLGVDAAPAPHRGERAGLGTGACFATPAGGELLVGGRKVLGSAQLRHGDSMLQHGSLLLGGSQRRITELTAGPAPESGETTLSAILGRAVPFEEAAEAILSSARMWEGRWHESGAREALAARATRHEAKFRSTEWTWRR
ncbi:MAG: lipoate--protein ligase family protein [Gemmatimonadota bacterium]